MYTENNPKLLNLSETAVANLQPALPRQKTVPFLQSIRSKTTAFVVALSVIPIGAVGWYAYNESARSVRSGAIRSQQELAQGQALQVSAFIFERYGDIQAIASLPIFANATVRRTLSKTEIESFLTSYARFYRIYDSIAFIDLAGNDLFLSAGTKPGNHAKDDYFQAVIRTGKPFISQPRFSEAVNAVVVFFAAPVRDSQTGKLIGVVRSRMPVKYLDEILQSRFQENASQEERLQLQYHIIDKQGKIFVAREASQQGNEDALKAVPVLAAMRAKGVPSSQEGFDISDPDKQLVTYIPGEFPYFPDLGWSVFVHQNLKVVYAAQQELAISLLQGTVIVAIVVVLISLWVTDRFVRPILRASTAVQLIGEGGLDVRIEVDGEDEVAALSANVNNLASQLSTLLEEQRKETERVELARQEARSEADQRAEEQQTAREFLQRRALELLIEVDPVSKGDLTVRASVTPDEVGTIADSYNAIIRNLRQIVQQVQDASASVVQTSQHNEEAVRSIAEEYLEQVNALKAAVIALEELSNSSKGVAARALAAKEQVQQADQVVQEGDQAMNRTVAGIFGIRETVASTAKKVKRLGESSQKISKVVNLISEFAYQTNLLSLNAAIEASRAGEEGRGFAVVAEEVRTLAEQSAAATAEIEQLVEEIQSQTQEVVAAMEEGTDQVVEGSKLVEEVRQKLTQIATVSTKITSLVEEIAQSAASQFTTSERVRTTMQQVATIAEKTSSQSEEVAESIEEQLQLAQSLQATAGQFKVR